MAKVERLYPISGDAESVSAERWEFMKTHKVVKEYMNLQVLMIPAKAPQQGRVHSINQPQQMSLVPQQVVNVILVYEE